MEFVPEIISLFIHGEVLTSSQRQLGVKYLFTYCITESMMLSIFTKSPEPTAAKHPKVSVSYHYILQCVWKHFPFFPANMSFHVYAPKILTYVGLTLLKLMLG